MAGQFVFIDARVSDLDTLVRGLVPGAQVRLLDPAHDGLSQIAEALRAAGARGLSAISIVAHGMPGRLEIGPDGLDTAALSGQAASLSVLAAALAERGALRLYACETGHGAGGRDFVAALSAALSGHPVAAASAPLGRGEPWTLDHVVAASADSAAPFTTQTQRAYRGILGITFTTGNSSTHPAGLAAGRVAVGDFDGDGDADILYQTGGDGTAFQYAQSNGNGTFTILTQAQSPFSGVTLANNSGTNTRVGDFNGDGKADIFTGAANSDGTVYLSGSNGTFTQIDATGISAKLTPGRTAVADFDGDGKADILYQTGGNGSAFVFEKGNGDGTFTEQTQAQSPFSGVTLVDNSYTNYYVGDFNGDGKADIFAGTANTDHTIYLSNSNGTYTQVDTTGLTAGSSVAILVGDFDSDGKADILYQPGGPGTAFRFAKSDGDGTFTDFAQSASPFANATLVDFGSTGTNYRAADFDGDRDIDVRGGVNSQTGSYYVQGSNSGGDGSPPTLASSTPTDNATGVATGANVVVTFDESVTKGTGNIEIVRISDNTVVETIAVTSANVTGSGTTWTINPTNDLTGGVEYGVRIASGTFVDTDGAVYPGNAASAISFTTQANRAPTANADAVSATEAGGVNNGTAGVNPSFNVVTGTNGATADTDPDQGDTITVQGVTAGTSQATLTTGAGTDITGSYGKIHINSDGSATYTVDNSNSTVGSLRTSTDTLTDTFSYTIKDAAGLTSTTQVVVTIHGANDAPSTPVDTDGAANLVDEGAAAGTVVGITASSTDPDGPALTYSLTTNPNNAFAINASTGVVTVADASKIDYESSGGSYNITVQASDGTFGASQNFTVTVTNVAPSVPTDGDGTANSVAEGAAAGTYTGLTASSSDVNGGTVSYTLTDDAGGRFTIGADGRVLVSALGATAIDYESSGGSYSVTVKAADPSGTFSTQTFSIGVANTAPSVPTDSDGTANSVAEGAATGTLVGITASSSDASGPPVTYSLTDPTNGGFTIDSGTGVVTVADGSKIDFETSGGSYTLVVQASDGALTSSQSFSVTVTNVNEPPVAANDAVAVAQRMSVNGNLIADAPVTDPDSTPTISNIAFGATSTAVSGANTVIAGDHGTLTIGTNGDYSYAANVEGGIAVGDTATDTFTYTASDGTLTDQASLTVTVTGSGQGDAGNNVFLLTGSGHTATGGDGNDTYQVDGLDDHFIESANGGTDTVKSTIDYTLTANVERLVLAGRDNIDGTGNADANIVKGNVGNNFIDGANGRDVLIGFGGSDVFMFKTALGSNNVDRITDFNPADDTIGLSKTVFAALDFNGTNGTLDPNQFASIDGTLNEKYTADDRIIYRSDKGALYYDADGYGGTAKAIQFAVLDGKPALSSTDFIDSLFA